jgi:hypothetical protein
MGCWDEDKDETDEGEAQVEERNDTHHGIAYAMV